MKRLLVTSIAAAAFAAFGATAVLADDDHFRRPRADHTTFTSQFEDYFACFCPKRSICRVHATISNLDTDPGVDIRFQDNDLVTVFVPPKTSHSLTQMMGTRDDKDVDNLVIFDPRDVGSLNPIVAWVSIERLGDEGRRKHNQEFGCFTVEYAPPPS